METGAKIEIRTVPAEHIIDLRHRILRAGLPRITAMFSGDDSIDAIHLGAFVDQTIVGCATLHRKSSREYQLRGMAVELKYQNHGIGAMLLAEAERLAAKSGAEIVWANCRTPAVAFYSKHGWEKVSEEFIVETAGPHYRMSKSLSPEIKP